jgi:hypothetical protein
MKLSEIDKKLIAVSHLFNLSFKNLMIAIRVSKDLFRSSTMDGLQGAAGHSLLIVFSLSIRQKTTPTSGRFQAILSHSSIPLADTWGSWWVAN